MKTIMVLYPSEQQNDAEHAMGVLEEELDIRNIPYHHIGKEILQTKKTRFIFRDIHQPSVQNKIKTIDKLYVMKDILKHEDVARYEHAEKKEWHNMPTGGLYDYLMDVKEEIPTETVIRYEIEENEVKKVQVESYKAHRLGYYETEEEAVAIVKERQEKEQARLAQQEAEKPKRRRKKEVERVVLEEVAVAIEVEVVQESSAQNKQLELLPL